MPTIQVTKVLLRREIIDRRDWVRYLGIPEWHARQVGEIIERIPDAAFAEFVENHVRSYIDGKAPPAGIMPAIMNIADDVVAGREPVLRAGDYIALQTAFREM